MTFCCASTLQHRCGLSILGRCDSGTKPSPSIPRARKFLRRMSTMHRGLNPAVFTGFFGGVTRVPGESLGEVLTPATPYGRCHASRGRPPLPVEAPPGSKCCSPRVPLFAARAPPEGAPGKVACRTCVVDAGLAAIVSSR